MDDQAAARVDGILFRKSVTKEAFFSFRTLTCSSAAAPILAVAAFPTIRCKMTL
jgi:hypothetical protein